MPPIPDLVRVSKLDTEFNSSPPYTQHVHYVSGTTSRQRRIRKEERWKRERRLGNGSFGIVWLERCIHGDGEGKVRAVKEVQKLENADYHRELEAIALFSHNKYEQCFVKSFGWYDDHDSIYITMEYLPDGDLHKYLNSSIPEKEGQQIISQVLEGLDFMHKNGFAHRDLKPANILVVCKGPDWWVKIADFGISKRATDGLTALRTVTGTPAFIAPEILGYIQSIDSPDQSYTNAIDIWSLGVITFLILTGTNLFRDQRRLGQYVFGNYSFPLDILLAKRVSQQGCEFVQSLLAPQPEDRPEARPCLNHPWLSLNIDTSPPGFERAIQPPESPPTQPFNPDYKLDYGADPEPSNNWTTKEQLPKELLPSEFPREQPKELPKEEPTFVEQIPDLAFYYPAKSRDVPDATVTALRPGSAITDDWKEKTTLLGHEKAIKASVFSPNGKLVASASADKTVRVWESATGKACGILMGHEGSIDAVTFSPDGTLLASGSTDKTVRLWDLVFGISSEVLIWRDFRLLRGHSSYIRALAFSPNGDLIVSASEDTTSRIWNSNTGKMRTILKGHLRGVWDVKFSPNGNLIASASEDKTVMLWSTDTGTILHILTGHSAWVWNLEFSPNSANLASASHDGTIKVWSLPTGVCRLTLEGIRKGRRSALAVAFSPDGRTIASGSEDNTVRIWNTANGAHRYTLKGHSGSVRDIAFSPDNKLIASSSDDGTVKLWSVVWGVIRDTFSDHSLRVNSVTFSPNGEVIASASADGTVKLWNWAALEAARKERVVSERSKRKTGAPPTKDTPLGSIMKRLLGAVLDGH